MVSRKLWTCPHPIRQTRQHRASCLLYSMPLPPQPPCPPADFRQEGLSPAEYDRIVQRLGRHPNPTELGMFGVMWSEHCCYKNSRLLLKQFPTSGPRILVGPGENAGVVDLGHGQRLVFKIESHNHPSAIEPFQGAATGVGGILRDVFTMGARPVALLNALRFGPLEDPRNGSLLEGVVAGIAHYGNCVGVPTVAGEVAFDPSYSGNPLVNAMAVGLLETDAIVTAAARGVGNPVLYVGSTTGRDGTGGASFASAELSDQSLEDRPAVQVGNPFFEKCLVEACLEAFRSGDVIAAQDMGAAGLTCSCAEMAAAGGVGILLDLDRVPAREQGMTAYEYLLSESQERMLLVVRAGREDAVMARFHRWGLYGAVVGQVMADPVVRILHHGEVAASVPAAALAQDTPVVHHTLLEDAPAALRSAWSWRPEHLPPASADGIRTPRGHRNWLQVLETLLDDPTMASKRWIWQQYDHQVQGNTVLGPGAADAAVIRLRPQRGPGAMDATHRALALTVDCNNRWVALDPREGGKAAVAEAARNLSCVGAEPLAVTDNLNFPSPNTPEGYWVLAKACQGVAEACRFLGTPVTGGNVSLYNETRRPDGTPCPIQPTPVIGMVGLVEDHRTTVAMGWPAADQDIWMLGVPLATVDERVSLAGSSYLAIVHGQTTGRPPRQDLALEAALQGLLRSLIRAGVVTAAHDAGEGGWLVALVESCLKGRRGARVNLPQTGLRADTLLFAEGGARVLVSLPSHQGDRLQQAASGAHVPCQHLGVVTATPTLQVVMGGQPWLTADLARLARIDEQAIPRRIESHGSGRETPLISQNGDSP